MTDSRDQSSVRRPVVVTAILLVALAVLLVALRSWLDRPAEEIGIGEVASIAADAESVEQAFEPEPIVERPVESARSELAAEALSPSSLPAEPLRVVLLPARMENPDPAGEFLLDAIRRATLRFLRGAPNIEVVEISSAEVAAVVPPNAGPLGEDILAFRAVSQRYDANVVAEVLERSPRDAANWSISLEVRRASGGWIRLSNSLSKTGVAVAANDIESIGRRFAEIISRGTDGPGMSSDLRDDKKILLDTTLSEQERVQALRRLQEEGFDSGTLAAAVDLAYRSPSAQTRQFILTILRQSSYDVTLAQPFSSALLTDQDPAVRKEAALGLGAYLGIAGSQAALEQAARNDSSPDVRLAARMALMDYDQQQDFRRDALLDRTLTPAERLAPTIASGRPPLMPFAGPSTADAAAEEALAYAEIIDGTDDVDLKLRALSALQGSMLIRGPAGSGSAIEPLIVNVLVESGGSADMQVRRVALQAMRRHADVPEIRTVLQDVVEKEPELAEDLGIPGALDRRPLPSGVVPPNAVLEGVRLEARRSED